MSTTKPAAPFSSTPFAVADKPKKLSRHERHELHVWLSNINRERKLRPSCTKVALVIFDHMPDSFPGTDTIAEEAGLSQSGVVAAVNLLEAAGYLAIERGSQGRGHSNRYRPIIKERRSTILAAKEAPAQPAMEKNTLAETKNTLAQIKYHPSDMNLKLTSILKEERASGARSARVDRDGHTDRADLAPTTAARAGGALEYTSLEKNLEETSPIDDAWDCLSGVYLRPPKTRAEEQACRAVFDEIVVDRGINTETLICAAEWCEDEDPLPLIDWLKRESWVNAKLGRA